MGRGRKLCEKKKMKIFRKPKEAARVIMFSSRDKLGLGELTVMYKIVFVHTM